MAEQKTMHTDNIKKIVELLNGGELKGILSDLSGKETETKKIISSVQEKLKALENAKVEKVEAPKAIVKEEVKVEVKEVKEEKPAVKPVEEKPIEKVEEKVEAKEEVKAEENLKAKSLKVYSEKYTPAITIRSSMSDYRHDEWLLNLPLYGISRILTECEKFI